MGVGRLREFPTAYRSRQPEEGTDGFVQNYWVGGISLAADRWRPKARYRRFLLTAVAVSTSRRGGSLGLRIPALAVNEAGRERWPGAAISA